MLTINSINKIIAVLLVSSLAQFANAACDISTGGANDCDSENTTVQNAMSGLEVDKTTVYCVPGQFTCRSLIQYRSDSTGIKTNDFFKEVFFRNTDGNPDINKGNAYVEVYWVKDSSGKYDAYQDFSSDKVVNIKRVIMCNCN